MKKLRQYQKPTSAYSWSVIGSKASEIMLDAMKRPDAVLEPCPHCLGTLIHSLTVNGLRYTSYLHTCIDGITWFDNDVACEWVHGPTLFQQIGQEIA